MMMPTILSASQGWSQDFRVVVCRIVGGILGRITQTLCWEASSTMWLIRGVSCAEVGALNAQLKAAEEVMAWLQLWWVTLFPDKIIVIYHFSSRILIELLNRWLHFYLEGRHARPSVRNIWNLAQRAFLVWLTEKGKRWVILYIKGT